jgi:flagellin
MPSTINTNISSLNAQRQLSTSQGQLATSMARLSSGLRVNSAKDDAAGLAIAERMHAQVRGMNVAMRNANDGISLAQTAEGALGQVGNALQRMRELAVQSRNATNSTADKDSLNKEFGELQKEVSRVIGGTTFNGLAILGSDASTMSFQVGANVGTNDTIDLALENLAENARLQAATGSAATSGQIAAANDDVRQAVLAALTGMGYAGEGQAVHDNYGSATTAVGAALEAVTAHAAHMGYSAQLATITAGLADATTGDEAYAAVLAGAQAMSWGNEAAPATTAKTAFEAFAAAIPSGASASIGSDADNDAIATVITNLDAAIGEVNDQRATFGATLSRFESVVGTLQVSVENQSAARSRIMDADFASETANLSRAQILQQAGNAMVAQANQLPQQVLALLG